MTNQRDDGGPAFPAPELGRQDYGQPGAYPGMSLRDYFAAKAMQELLTIIEMLCNGIEWNIENHHEEMTQADEEALAQGRAALSKYGSKQ